jgi:hypothetical protein
MEGPAQWQFGSGGPRLKASGGALQARNAADDKLVELLTAGPCRSLTNARRSGTSPLESWYVGSYAILSTFTNLAATADKLYLTPFSVEEYETLDRLGLRVTAAAAGSCRLGIYALDLHALTGSLVLDAGTVSTGTTGVKTLSVSAALSPGWYGLASVFEAAPTIAQNPVSNQSPVLGVGADLSTRQHTISAAFTFDALPSTFAGLTLAGEAAMGAHVFMRRSA